MESSPKPTPGPKQEKEFLQVDDLPITKLKTGSSAFDTFLQGGIEKGIVTTVFGPGGSGKTLICILAAIATAREGKKVIYMDTEGGFSVDRLKQIAPDAEKIIEKMLFTAPTSFEEQKEWFDKLRNHPVDEIGIIIVDTIAMLYRLEIGKSEEVYAINKELGRQISWLNEIARKRKIPIVIANQVYSAMEDNDEVKMVGGDFLKYGSKCLIELKALSGGNRLAIIRKHRSIPPHKQLMFKIVNDGVMEVKESAPSAQGPPLPQGTVPSEKEADIAEKDRI